MAGVVGTEHRAKSIVQYILKQKPDTSLARKRLGNPSPFRKGIAIHGWAQISPWMEIHRHYSDKIELACFVGLIRLNETVDLKLCIARIRNCALHFDSFVF